LEGFSFSKRPIKTELADCSQASTTSISSMASAGGMREVSAVVEGLGFRSLDFFVATTAVDAAAAALVVALGTAAVDAAALDVVAPVDTTALNVAALDVSAVVVFPDGSVDLIGDDAVFSTIVVVDILSAFEILFFAVLALLAYPVPPPFSETVKTWEPHPVVCAFPYWLV
jgi:hypothetical protein